MIERTILNQLRHWREKENRKPLVLRGARQVGKSTVVDMLGKEFDNYLKFNLDEDMDKEMLENPLPLDDLINSLFARRSTLKRPGETLIFIDEIQNSPKTISRLRYFKEERPDIHVIAAGSLLENVVDVQASFPVGRVEYIRMHPCCFKEFMGAMGHELWEYFILNPEQSQPMHLALMSLFNQYTIVGGMPEVVNMYAHERDVLALDDIYDSLLQGYRDDVEKYTRRGKLTEIVRFLIENCWLKAGEKVTLAQFEGSPYQSREVKEAFMLLEKAMLVELTFPTTATSVPGLPEMTRKPKLLTLDCGLTNYKAGVRKELIAAKDILDVWRGHMAEQVVGQELLALTNRISSKRLFWTKGKDVAEVDFLLNHDSMLIPIEVKNGHNSHLGSLHSFMEKAPHQIGVRIWSQPFSVNDVTTTIGKRPFRLINLPFYMIGNLPAIIDTYC